MSMRSASMSGNNCCVRQSGRVVVSGCSARKIWLRFIKSAQELGFSLEEIRELLRLRSDEGRACPKMQKLLQAKLLLVDTKITTLKAMKAELKTALQKCEAALEDATKPDALRYPVLDEISARGRTGAKR